MTSNNNTSTFYDYDPAIIMTKISFLRQWRIRAAAPAFSDETQSSTMHIMKYK